MGHQVGKKVVTEKRVTAKGVHDPLETLLLEHSRSLAGSLRSYVKRTAPTEEALWSAREAARAASANERMSGQISDVSRKTER